MTETLCVCGHAAESHTHLRDGRDCSRCGRELCREFRPLTWWRRVLNRVGWYPAPLPDPVPAVDLPWAVRESILSLEQWDAVTRNVDAAATSALASALAPPDTTADPASLFTPARFQVVPREKAWHAGAERVWSPEQWEQIASAFVPASEQPTLSFAALIAHDADGHPISIGDWVQFLDGGQIGEVVATLGQWCEVRIPTSSAPRAEHGGRLRVIEWEES